MAFFGLFGNRRRDIGMLQAGQQFGLDQFQQGIDTAGNFQPIRQDMLTAARQGAGTFQDFARGVAAQGGSGAMARYQLDQARQQNVGNLAGQMGQLRLAARGQQFDMIGQMVGQRSLYDQMIMQRNMQAQENRLGFVNELIGLGGSALMMRLQKPPIFNYGGGGSG